MIKKKKKQNPYINEELFYLLREGFTGYATGLTQAITYYYQGDLCSDCEKSYANCECEKCECGYNRCLCDWNVIFRKKDHFKTDKIKIATIFFANNVLDKNEFKNLISASFKNFEISELLEFAEDYLDKENFQKFKKIILD